MKRLLVNTFLTVLTFTLLLANAAGAQKKLDTEKENLLGPVRSIRSQMTDYIDGKLGGKTRTKQLDIVTYDANGNEVERTIYNDYGFLVGKETHCHDANGNLIESVLADPKGVVMERRVYSYEFGKLTQIVSYGGKGNAELKQVNSFGETGQLSEETYYNPKKPAGKTVYNYDKKGNVSQVAFYLANGSKATAPIGPCLGAHRVTYSYNEKNMPAMVVAYESDGQLKKSWQYTYNHKGQIAKDRQESAWSRTTFVYSYEYDSHGNWTKRIANVNEKSKLTSRKPSEWRTIISREIVYVH